MAFFSLYFSLSFIFLYWTYSWHSFGRGCLWRIFGPIIGMLGFSLVLFVCFFAAFPGWLNSLPQSGGWLNSVKVTWVFRNCTRFKFLSNADLVLQLPFLKSYSAIWVIIFMLLTFYLLGFIRFAHDSDLKYLSVTRLSLAIITGAFTIYMIQIFWDSS